MASHTDWFVHDRFGMFLHWGLYALPARHEWVMQYEQIPPATYERYFRQFNPDLYDPEAWAEAAAQAGMKYMVITSKHHEGFCLWDSALTDYKAPNTPIRRDLLHPMIDAFRNRGLKVGFYHSLIDWHHPDFLIDDLHALRNHPDRDKLNESRVLARYTEYLHGQVRELLTQFGKIDIMWYDFSYPREEYRKAPGDRGKGRNEWGSEALLKLTRELQPGIIVNDRLDLSDVPGGWDFRTPEQYVPKDGVMVDGKPVLWEACQTFSGSWGYYRDEASWKSPEQLVRMLVDSVSKGGNLLLNVGPTARGEFDARAKERLAAMGEWMDRHDRAISGCGRAPWAEFGTPQDGRFTYNPETRRLYVHIFAWPFLHFHLPGLAGKVEYAQLLNDASEVKLIERGPTELPGAAPQGEEAGLLALELPVRQPEVTVPVVELFLKQELRVRQAYLYALLAVLCWTTGPVGSKAALASAQGAARLTPLQVAFWAIALGWLVLLLQLLVTGRGARLREVSPRGWLIIAAMGLFGWMGYPVAINLAYTRLPLSEAMIVSNLNPVLVVLLQGAWFGGLVRRVSGWEQQAEARPTTPVLRVALGLALCLGGVIPIATGGRLATLLEFHLSFGVVAALFAAFAWAVYSNLGRFVAVRPGSDPERLAEVQNLGAMTAGLAVMAVLLGMTGEWRPPAGFVTTLFWAGAPLVQVNTWSVIAAMGLLNYAVGYTLWLHSLEAGTRAGEAHRLPPLTYLLIVLAVPLAWLLLREPVRPIFWIGAAFIAAGNVVTLWPARREVALVAGR